MITFRRLLLLLLLVGNGLLLTPEGSAFRVMGALILLLLPGLVWADRLLVSTPAFERWLVGAGLSYSLVMMAGLLLHYLPGPIPLWTEVITFNTLGLGPLLWPPRGFTKNIKSYKFFVRSTALGLTFLVIIFLAAYFRFASLGYSEFQGDEIGVMQPAAEALEGHQDALFLYRKKGPGEVLLPMMLWGLTGTINELTARLPFALAGLLLIPTIYLLGVRWLNHWTSLVAAGLLALNGLLVAFSRMAQYQTLVVWLSALALLCLWEWRKHNHIAWLMLASIFWGAGLLAHYDAVLISPALVYLIISKRKLIGRALANSLLMAGGSLLFITGLFYWPYFLNQQMGRTTEYLADRIGQTFIQNNLDIFLEAHVFYNSLYYVIIVGLPALALLVWALSQYGWVRRIPGGRYWLPGLTFGLVVALLIWPHTLTISGVDLAALPFALIFLGAFFSPAFGPGQRVVILWLAVPFLFYNFAVDKPGTHTYTMLPGLVLWTGLAVVWGWRWLVRTVYRPQISTGRRFQKGVFIDLLPFMAAVLLAALFSGYLYIAYLRHQPEFKQDWPKSRSVFYWSPYKDLPTEIGLFGYAHQSGWKVAGALYAAGRLSGNYGSNEHIDVTSWYIRDSIRTCEAQPKYYLAADTPLGFSPLNLNIVAAHYAPIGRVTLPNDKGLTFFQVQPASEMLGYLQTEPWIETFDRTATPAAFAYAHRESRSVEAAFAGSIRLVRYDVNALKTKPGGQIEVVLYWQTQEKLATAYHVFVHVEGDGTPSSPTGVWGQSDGSPACQLYPIPAWQPGQLVPDPRVVTLNPATPPGNYAILVGMYTPDTGERLDVVDETGQPVANFVKLTTVTIQ